MTYVYGMRLRGFAPGCQPLDGLIETNDDPQGRYHTILKYNRQLSDDEITQYELDDLTGISEAMAELLNAFNDTLKAATGRDMHELTRYAATGGWHVLPHDLPEIGDDVILQYRADDGLVYMMVSSFDGDSWRGCPHYPQAWHDLPDPFDWR